jgi:hypothetical protein
MNDGEPQESEEDVKNDEWFKKNFIDLMQKYPREWIAVKDCEIIATGLSKNEVADMADEIAGEEEYSLYFVPPTSTFTDTGYTNR